MSEALLGTYNRLPVTFARGEGVHLYDAAGRRYLDMLAGIAVCSLGHSHPDLTAALQDQAATLLHVSNLFSTDVNAAAAEAIATRIAPGKVFFCNSGAEANEAAIKLARKHAWRRGERDRYGIVALEGSFHGRTLSSLAATIQPAKWEGFGPLPAGFVGIRPDDTTALETAVGPGTAAVIVEPILGEGGIRPLTDDYLRAAREACDRHGALLVCDEIQTGVGRTGDWWAFSRAGIVPDVVTLAKGLGGGVPVGAMWASDAVSDALRPGDHATTFGGNPLASRAVATVLEVIDRDGLVDNAAKVGEQLSRDLEPLGREVRGRGLLLALELRTPNASAVVESALRLGLVVNAVSPSAIRLAPPLTITAPDATEAVALLADAIAEVGA